jgi:hypothetical protein
MKIDLTPAGFSLNVTFAFTAAPQMALKYYNATSQLLPISFFFLIVTLILKHEIKQIKHD